MSTEKINYPKNELVWVNYRDRTGELRFILTSKENREQYFLYELKNGAFVRLGKAKDPPALVEKYKVMERLRE